MSILAWKVLRHKSWLWHTDEWNQATTSSSGASNDLTVDLKSYYLLYAARYASDTIPFALNK